MAALLKPADLHNGATHGRSGVIMTKWEIAGLTTTAPTPGPDAPAAAPPAFRRSGLRAIKDEAGAAFAGLGLDQMEAL